MRVGADGVEVMEGSRERRDMGEGAEGTGGEGCGDVVGAVGVMRESVSMVFGMISRGDVEETNVTEGTEVKEELDSWRCAKGSCGVMKIRIVLGDPPGREEAVLSGDVMREGASEVGGGVRRNGVVKMIEGILEV